MKTATYEGRTFAVVNGAICRAKKRKGGDLDWVPLCNFNARIVEQTDHYMRIRGAHEDGTELQEIVIPAKSFRSMRWVIVKWGGRLAVEPGPTARADCARGIMALSLLGGIEGDAGEAVAT